MERGVISALNQAFNKGVFVTDFETRIRNNDRGWNYPFVLRGGLVKSAIKQAVTQAKELAEKEKDGEDKDGEDKDGDK